MDIRKIRRLIELLEGSDVNEIEITEGEESVRISRGAQVQVASAAPVQPVAPVGPPAPAAPTAAASEPEEEEAGVTVEAPMVGTFYRAPTPEAEPYVREGDRVNVGDTLCVIEAMKLFNEIESEYSGVIKRILVENAQPVEFGEHLFLIDSEG